MNKFERIRKFFTDNYFDQQYALRKGVKWEDFTFEERTYKGWLLPYLLELDLMFSKRWDYWLRTLLAGELLNKPIPKIDFSEQPNTEVLKNIKDCVTAYICHDVKLQDFLKWILWGFGEGEESVKISKEVNEHWYRTFNLGLLLKYPYDYFGDMIADTKIGKTYWTNPNGFFATPMSLVKTMVETTMEKHSVKGKNLRSFSVYDPCVGTGRFLMYASNYTLSLYGQDIDSVCVRACKINGYLYVPWLAKGGESRVEGLGKKRIESGIERCTRAKGF